jgi:hypothetical protein
MESLQRLIMRKPLAGILCLCTRTDDFNHLICSSNNYSYNYGRSLTHGAKHNLILYKLPSRRVGGYMLLN